MVGSRHFAVCFNQAITEEEHGQEDDRVEVSGVSLLVHHIGQHRGNDQPDDGGKVGDSGAGGHQHVHTSKAVETAENGHGAAALP